jgi:hypothetical protein
MFCPQCGSPNPDEARFCRVCAATLPTQPQAGRPEEPSTSGLESPTQYLPPDPPRPAQPGEDSGYRSSFGGQTPPDSSPPYTAYMSQNPPPSYSPGPSYAGYQPPGAGGSASGRAITSMVLSLVSLVTCGFLFSIPGMILGKMEMDAIREGRAPQAGETFAKVGFWLGLVVTVISCVLGGLWALAFVGSLGGALGNM